MKSSRTWNRRDFSVTANGYFTVLKPDGWFPTIRLPGGFRYRFGQPRAIASPQPSGNLAEFSTASAQPGRARIDALQTLNHGVSQQALSGLQILPPGTADRSLIRPVLIALAATAIAFLLLCWIAWPLIRGYLDSIAN